MFFPESSHFPCPCLASEREPYVTPFPSLDPTLSVFLFPLHALGTEVSPQTSIPTIDRPLHGAPHMPSWTTLGQACGQPPCLHAVLRPTGSCWFLQISSCARKKCYLQMLWFLRLILLLLKFNLRGTWVAQSVRCLTSVQVMISQFMGSSPTSGSVLTAQSLEIQILCFLSLSHLCSVSLHLSKMNKD